MWKYAEWGVINVNFDRAKSASKTENSQNIALLPRNMCKKIQLDYANTLVLCTSFREREFVLYNAQGLTKTRTEDQRLGLIELNFFTHIPG